MSVKTMKVWGVIACVAGLYGCGSDDDSKAVVIKDDAKPYTEITLDATSSTEYVYLNMVNGEVVSDSDVWHIAFKRYNTKLGSEVEGAIGDEQTDYYSGDTPVVNAFVNATAEGEEQSLYDVLGDSGLVFESSDVVPYIDSADWYIYNHITHALSANADNYWMLKSAEGNSYAKMHVSSISGNNATLDFFTQLSGETAYSATADASFSVSLTTNANTCFDFDSNATVDCDSSSLWDIQIRVEGYNYITVLNSGASGSGSAAAYGPITLTEADTYVAASDVVVYAYGTDQNGGVFNSYVWQEYAVTGESGDHGIWPNYRVYVIDTDKDDADNELLKLQVINYYNESGASGFITLRYMSLSDNGE